MISLRVIYFSIGRFDSFRYNGFIDGPSSLFIFKEAMQALQQQKCEEMSI